MWLRFYLASFFLFFFRIIISSFINIVLEELFLLMAEFRDIEANDLMNMEDIPNMRWDEIAMDADIVNKPTRRRFRHKPMHRNEDGDT